MVARSGSGLAERKCHDHTIIRFEQGERLLLDDSSAMASARRSEMQAWRKRHAIWTAAAGGVLPNIWIRRQSDLCEMSYDPGTTVGAPGAFEFQFSRGTAFVDVALVAKAMLEFLTWGSASAADAGHDLPLPNQSIMSADTAERWLIGDHLTELLSNTNIEAPHLSDGVIYPMSPEVAMFGTLTPNLPGADAGLLLDALQRARSTNPERSELAVLTTNMAPATRETSWEQGYELAIQTIESLGVNETRPGFVDVVKILHALGVEIKTLAVSDLSLRGVAIAGEGFRPTVIVNSQAKWNKSNPGRRFTLAHELGHILVDRGQAGRVTHSSTPWAPEAVERRANAFAAMFLMPYRAVDAALSAIGPVTNERDLALLARRLACGKGAVLEHLMNIDRIDPDHYFRIKSEFVEI